MNNAANATGFDSGNRWSALLGSEIFYFFF